MGEALNTKIGEVSLDEGRTPFGKEMLKHFLFDSNFKSLNHGIFACSNLSNVVIDINNQAPLVASLGLFARSSKSTRKPVKRPQIHSSATRIPNSWTSLEPL